MALRGTPHADGVICMSCLCIFMIILCGGFSPFYFIGSVNNEDGSLYAACFLYSSQDNPRCVSIGWETGGVYKWFNMVYLKSPRACILDAFLIAGYFCVNIYKRTSVYLCDLVHLCLYVNTHPIIYDVICGGIIYVVANLIWITHLYKRNKGGIRVIVFAIISGDEVLICFCISIHISLYLSSGRRRTWSREARQAVTTYRTEISVPTRWTIVVQSGCILDLECLDVMQVSNTDTNRVSLIPSDNSHLKWMEAARLFLDMNVYVCTMICRFVFVCDLAEPLILYMGAFMYMCLNACAFVDNRCSNEKQNIGL